MARCLRSSVSTPSSSGWPSPIGALQGRLGQDRTPRAGCHNFLTRDFIDLQDVIDPNINAFESTHMPPEMKTIFQCHRTYVSEVEMYEDGMQVGTDMLCDHRNTIQWHIMSLLPSTQLGSSHASTYPLYEACRLALIIFGVGVTFPLPPQSAPLATLGRMLKIELQAYYEEAKEVPPSARSLYVWILTLGVSPRQVLQKENGS
ncbi:hypothetical protein N7509_007004 [Penicillium cosmopolitanum]|uniref:Uncharacterized protein n=1 Tax=Penicillium cosmopolitanum TaxID=1131564 RepID=A0A9W9VY71_9EURO|nr:uncharacterized protein N7509_007004 [Penicillium cosmopolitanum]KAJ5391514.1 hypothetical protein N7509_007004 [Penicillium cosmopolitanum]